MRHIIYKHKLLALFSVIMFALLATREEQGIIAGPDGQPLTDVSYTFQMQRDYDAKIKKRIEAYNLNNI